MRGWRSIHPKKAAIVGGNSWRIFAGVVFVFIVIYIYMVLRCFRSLDGQGGPLVQNVGQLAAQRLNISGVFVADGLALGADERRFFARSRVDLETVAGLVDGY